MSNSDDESRQFHAVAVSALTLQLRHASANAALYALLAAHHEFVRDDAQGKIPRGDEAPEWAKHHRAVEPDKIEHLESVHAANIIIASLALFDSFLSDVTRFLLIRNPGALGAAKQVQVSEILRCESYSEVIGFVTGKLLREVAYKRLSERLQFLSYTFGINLASNQGDIAKLQEYADLRNDLLHDISVFAYRTEREKGRVGVQRRGETEVSAEFASKVFDLCGTLVEAIFDEVSTGVFHGKLELRPGSTVAAPLAEAIDEEEIGT